MVNVKVKTKFKTLSGHRLYSFKLYTLISFILDSDPPTTILIDEDVTGEKQIVGGMGEVLEHQQ